MQNMNRCLALLGLLLVCQHFAFAKQSTIMITSDTIAFPQFASLIEKEWSVRVYYDTNDVKGLKIIYTSSSKELKTVLSSALNNTPLQFSIFRDQVFITKGIAIQTSLPNDYFNQTLTVEADSVTPVAFELNPIIDKKLEGNEDRKLIVIGQSINSSRTNAVVTGYIRDKRNGEAIVGALLYTDTPSIKVLTDQYGFFTLSLPKGRQTIFINSVGMKDTKREVQLNGDGKLNIEMDEYVASLKSVIVRSEKTSNVRSLLMGVDRLNVKAIRQVPAILGETDILRVVLTLPGVTSVGEASTGFNVRGGAADQNLILYNDATIYNPSHLFGFFSAFNADAVKGVELYKSAIPERYGGRLSSVLDVTSREGNSKKSQVSGGIGLLTSRLTLEGPMNKGKTNYILSGRTTYSDWLLAKVPDKTYQNSKASFHDVSLNITHTISEKDRLYITGYLSNDRFNLNSDTIYHYGNRNLILKWKHSFNERFFGTVSTGIDQYRYDITSDRNPLNAYRLLFGINQAHIRTEFTYNVNEKHTFNFGVHTVKYNIQPGDYQPKGSLSIVTRDKVPPENALETAIYLGDKVNINKQLSLNLGIRYSMFNYLGPAKVYQYVPNLPRQLNNVIDSQFFSKNKSIKFYNGLEFRIASRYTFSDNESIKFSFNTLRQYIHSISNTASISPTDIWKLSDTYIKPQTGYQISFGYYRNLSGGNIEASVEIFYKHMNNYLDYKSGAKLLLNQQLETDVLSTQGRSWGAEFLFRKNSGKLNGWISYTYSRVFLRVNDPLAGEQINNGNEYPANFDKPHNFNLVLNYRFSHRLSLSMNAVYSTGRPITLPIAIFTQAGAQRVLYSDRNQFRIEDYIRSDLSVNFEGNHKKKKLAHSSWSLGVYNVLARQNPYSVFFVAEASAIKGYQLSVFGTAIPFITYNFKF